MNSARRIVVVAAFGLAALACAQTESAPAENAEGARHLVTVRMNLLPSMTYAPAAIAEAEGYFDDEGIDFESVRVDANSALLAAGSGSLDVVANPVRSGLFNIMVRGIPFQIVADDGHEEPGPCAPTAFTAPPDLAARVRASGLRGQRVATIKGGITEFMVTRLLASQGLTINDVEIVEYPPGEASMGEFKVIDAVRSNFEPNLTTQKEKGLIEVVVPMYEIVPGLQRNVIAFGNRLLNEDPDLGRRFMRAWLRGVRRYNEGKTDRNVEIITRHTELPAELVRQMCWPFISTDGQIPNEAVQPLLVWAKERGYLEGDVPREKWWNPTYIDAANRGLAQAGEE